MIEGKLVNLRAREMSDLERNTRWVNDRDVTRYILVRYPMSALAEENWMRDGITRPMSPERVSFAIETKDGRHIGNSHLAAVPEDRKAMLGIMIGEHDCWSHGYGTDTVLTMLRFAFDEMNLNRVALAVFDFNERARACYRKCGFVEEGRLRAATYFEGAYHDEVLMAILRDEFYALRGTVVEKERTR
jgi:RimJ/RimL family protein N-acetyltransferase